MSTLIVSDLHLGSAGAVDVLRSASVREALWQQLQDADRLLLLGDVLELRHRPRRDVLRAARPFFAELGQVFDGEVVVVAGNHDHALIEPWLERRGELSPGPLALQQRLTSIEASAMLQTIAAWTEPAQLTVAYPGLWVREDVYATHGHYLDCHLTIPTLERLAIGAMGRLLRRPEPSLHSVDDYEALTAPIFAWLDSVAQRAAEGTPLTGRGTARAWRALNGEHAGGPLTARVRSRLLTQAFPLVVAALNRSGIGSFGTDVSGGEIRRACLRAMDEVTRRLAITDAYVVFGHTHRAGPLPHEHEPLWHPSTGVRLINAGCWTYDANLLTGEPGASPYWPGCCVLVEQTGPPRLLRLLSNRPHSELSQEGGA